MKLFSLFFLFFYSPPANKSPHSLSLLSTCYVYTTLKCNMWRVKVKMILFNSLHPCTNHHSHQHWTVNSSHRVSSCVFFFFVSRSLLHVHLCSLSQKKEEEEKIIHPVIVENSQNNIDSVCSWQIIFTIRLWASNAALPFVFHLASEFTLRQDETVFHSLLAPHFSSFTSSSPSLSPVSVYCLHLRGKKIARARANETTVCTVSRTLHLHGKWI